MSAIASATADAPTPPSDPHRWFKQEVHVHTPQLKAWIAGTFPAARSHAEDIAQESLLRVWQRQAVKPIDQVKAFLFKAARNITIDLLRRDRSSPVDAMGTLAASTVIDETPDAAATLTTQEKYALLAEAMATLPDRCYQVVLLHKFKGLSQKDTAHQLGISEHTVANQIQIAITRCEAYLRKRGVTSLRD